MKLHQRSNNISHFPCSRNPLLATPDSHLVITPYLAYNPMVATRLQGCSNTSPFLPCSLWTCPIPKHSKLSTLSSYTSSHLFCVYLHFISLSISSSLPFSFLSLPSQHHGTTELEPNLRFPVNDCPVWVVRNLEIVFLFEVVCVFLSLSPRGPGSQPSWWQVEIPLHVTVQIVVTFPDNSSHHRPLNSFTFQLPLWLSPSPECAQTSQG
jgi:hypothetical protein